MNHFNCLGNRQDFGGEPLVIGIGREVRANTYFRRALWTGEHLQVTVMSIPPHGEIGLEIHPDVDQFIQIESGCGLVKMGQNKCDLNQIKSVNCEFAVIIPAGTWHNIVNTGNVPLKLYSVYAPPQHPFGTVHETKAIADAEGD